MKIGKVAEDENKYVGIFRIKKRFPKPVSGRIFAAPGSLS